MHVVIATDGSRQSLTAAKQFKSFADPKKITDISIVAVIRPLAAVGFASDLSPSTKTTKAPGEDPSARQAASDAIDAIAAVFDGWDGKIHKRIRGGSPANEIIKAAKQYGAGLVVIAAGGRGLSETVLMGSTAQRIQHYAPCPVLVVRPAKKSRRDAMKSAAKKAVGSSSSTSAKKAPAKKTAAKKTSSAPAKKTAAKKTAAKKAPAKKAPAKKST